MHNSKSIQSIKSMAMPVIPPVPSTPSNYDNHHHTHNEKGQQQENPKGDAQEFEDDACDSSEGITQAHQDKAAAEQVAEAGGVDVGDLVGVEHIGGVFHFCCFLGLVVVVVVVVFGGGGGVVRIGGGGGDGEEAIGFAEEGGHFSFDGVVG